MITERYYQKEAKDAVITYFKRNKVGNPVVAMPTGSGKTIVISSLIKECVQKWNIDVLLLSHRKELLEQNHRSLIKHIKDIAGIDIGIYSAGLGIKTVGKVTIAGIQSIRDKHELFKNVKLIIIDEAHLISTNENTSYRKLLSNLPKARVVGFTATPYRLGTGLITSGNHIFDEIVYDITSRDAFNRLIDEGYLTKLISKRTQIELDAEKSDIATQAGDYKEADLSRVFNVEAITKLAISELVKNGVGYKRWLIFAINISHAESIASELTKHKISAIPVHSKMSLDRDSVLKSFEEGKIRALVNVNILTVGIDVPSIDLIALLRPTKSTALYVQAVGRGLRVHPGKDHCLILDYAKNVQTLGPVNDVIIKVKRKGSKGQPITKICPKCDSIVAPSVRSCPNCGYTFQFKTSLECSATDKDILNQNKELWYYVDNVRYSKYSKPNSPNTLRVTYVCGIKSFNEWVCIEHHGYAKEVATKWFDLRTNGINPSKVDEALALSPKIKTPHRILVREGGKYPQILKYDLG